MTHNGEIIPRHNSTVVFYDIENSAILTTDNHMVTGNHVFYRNQSEYQVLQPEFDLNFSNCYLVEMKLEYTEYHIGFSGTAVPNVTEIHQVVVFNQNLEPVLIGINHTTLCTD